MNKNKSEKNSAAVAYFNRFSVHPDKRREFAGFPISALGLGTYLGDANDLVDRLYEHAMVHAVSSGLNVMDTAANYRCQRSERCIGYALKKLAGMGIPREALLIATKGGFLPADGDPQGFGEHVLKSYINTGILTPDDIVANCHAMTPKFIDSQIRQSLANLRVDTIDLYYLHNPETQLKAVGTEEFYTRLTKAFAKLEEHVASGNIGHYGLATWNAFRLPLGQSYLLDLNRVISCARMAGGDNHSLRAIQLPYNLAMLEAVALKNQKVGEDLLPILPAAVHHGLSVFISAPLLQGQIGSVPHAAFEKISVGDTVMQKALQFVTSSPGVVCAMAGAKEVHHIDDNKMILAQRNLSVEELQDVARQLVKI